MNIVVRQGEAFPDWCEVKSFSQLDLPAAGEARIVVTGQRARLLATAVSFQVRQGGRSQVLREQQFFDLEPGEAVLTSTNALSVISAGQAEANRQAPADRRLAGAHGADQDEVGRGIHGRGC